MTYSTGTMTLMYNTGTMTYNTETMTLMYNTGTMIYNTDIMTYIYNTGTITHICTRQCHTQRVLYNPYSQEAGTTK